MENKKFRLIWLIAIGVLVFPILTRAQTEPRSEVYLIATTNLYDAKVVSQDGNKIKLAFDINNRDGIQSDIRYAVSLLKLDKDGQVIDEQGLKNYQEVIAVGQGETIKKEIVYDAPEYLFGEYMIAIYLKSGDSLILGLGRAGKVVLNGSAGYLSIDRNSCYIKVEGENGDKKYELLAGVDVNNDENIIGYCQVKNNFQKDINFTADFTNHYRTTVGDVVEAESRNNPKMSFTAGESREIYFSIPKAKQPQAYDAVMVFKDEFGKKISNEVIFHYVLRGASATVQNVVLEKNSYVAGEIANGTFNWSGSADSFYGSRKGGTGIGEATIEIYLSDEAGNLCSDKFKKGISSDPFERSKPVEFSVKIQKDCPLIKINSTIANETGILTQKTSILFNEKNIEKPKQENKKENFNFEKIALRIVLFMAVLSLILILIFKIKNKNTVGLFLLFGILFLAPNIVKADTWTYWQWGDDNGNNRGSVVEAQFTVNLNSRNFNVGDDMTASGIINYTECSNGQGFPANLYREWDSNGGGRETLASLGGGSGDRWYGGWGWRNFGSRNSSGNQTVGFKFESWNWGSSLRKDVSMGYYVNCNPNNCAADTCVGQQCNNGCGNSWGIKNCSPCVLPWGGTVASGASVSAYQAASVACGLTCTSENRVCNSGILSGSYTNQSCSITPCQPCNLPWGGTIIHGASVTAYGQSTCSGCSSENRACSNGTLSGTYTSQSCSPLQSSDGQCGSANGNQFDSEPTDNLCSVGSSTDVTGDGPWSWTCLGTCSGASSEQCVALKSGDSYREVAP
ncbi:MAG: hypothetical protein UT50_C0015G0011 [Candidatus Moranbacteria bacterium GW2011_GWA2_39_41]|nr:MAG: hypothetical protein UT50_C0015G0011 [Candidatus Moranbacteria bacterium GW2011_GWA2_39_41]